MTRRTFLSTATITFGVLAFLVSLVHIWTEDERWYDTSLAFVYAFTALLLVYLWTKK